jgi:hypothetical protein
MAEQTPIRVVVVTVIGRQSVRLPAVVAGIAVLTNRADSALMNQESFIRPLERRLLWRDIAVF